MDCPVCFEIFNTPLLLPGCGHTICRKCAELIVTPENYLRCPECRLVYQLRRGVASLPKNIALQRTIDESKQGTENETAKGECCQQHPGETVSLYCKTCEVSICLKCYFTDASRSKHADHEVNTSTDVLTREKRLLEDVCKNCEATGNKEKEYLKSLEQGEQNLENMLKAKIQEIDKKKDALITKIKQTSGKLKHTLKGSCSCDKDNLKMALESARERVDTMDKLVMEAGCVLSNASPDVNKLIEVRQNMEKFSLSSECRDVSSFVRIEHFDTDIERCIQDSKRALSYQTEVPKPPTIDMDDCVVSDTKAIISVKYDQQLRVERLTVFFKESLYKGMSEKIADQLDVIDFTNGVGQVLLRGLQLGTMYRLYAVAYNGIGASQKSNIVWFRTSSTETEIRAT